MQKLLNTRVAMSNSMASMGAAQSTSQANQSKKTFTTAAEVVQLQIMKETMTYVVENFEQALAEATESKACERAYVLPDGQKIILGKERFCCPEILFQPWMAEREDIDSEGIQKHIYDSVMKCDEAIRRDFFKHIYLAGGSTLFPNIS